jgi:competence protein ComEA
VPEPLAPSTLTREQRRELPDEQAFWERRFDDPPRPPSDDAEPTRRERRATLPRPRPELGERLADRVRDLLADTRAGVVALVVVAVVAGFVWYRMGAGGASHGSSPATSEARPATATTAVAPTGASSAVSAAAKPAAAPANGRVVVHVAGAVTKPGVVELPAGSRVIDAVEAVGGALPDSDLDRLNLAAKVADGQRIYVAKPGAADPGAATDGGDPTTGAPAGKLDLNTATQAQLEALPGVGPSFAQAILAERQRRGGFTSVNELRSVRGIGDKRFADLAPLVTV